MYTCAMVSQVHRSTRNVTATICWLSGVFREIFPCALIWFLPEIHAPSFGWHPENTCDFSFWNTVCSLLHAGWRYERSLGKGVTSSWAICHNNSENYRIRRTHQHDSRKRAHLFSPASKWDFLPQTKRPLPHTDHGLWSKPNDGPSLLHPSSRARSWEQERGGTFLPCK